MDGHEKYVDLPDEALVARFQNGETDIMDYLLEKYKDLVLKISRKFFLIGGEPDDVLQEGMIGLYSAIGSFDTNVGSPFGAFARLCVDRMMVAVLRASSRKRRIPKSKISRLDDTLHIADGSCADPEAIVIAKEDFERFVNKAQNELSTFETDVFNAFISGCSYKSISDRLCVSVQSVDNALQRIRRKLKNR